MPAKPPPNTRRRRAPLAAAARRMVGTPTGGGPRIISQSPQPTTRGGPIVTSRSPQPTTGTGRIAQAETVRKAPPRTLGHATYKSETFTGQTGTNPNTAPTAYGHPMHFGSRAGKKFKIGFTPDGRIVHLYGADVNPGERRVVLPQSAGKLKLMDAAQRRARRRA